MAYKETAKDGKPITIVQHGYPDIYFKDDAVLVQDWTDEGDGGWMVWGYHLVTAIEVF